MSCIRFNTPAQRAQLARMAPSMRTPEEVAAQHPAPPVTDSKIRRIRLLASDANPKIRASAAASYHLPEDVAAELADDPDAEVRRWLARNETVSCDLLRQLAHDDEESVRAFVAVNFFAPEDAMAELADDASATVRGLVEWKTSLRAAAHAVV
jgi:hypothetical protein